MPLTRRLLLMVTIALVVGSLGLTSYYGLHLRSESYRKEVNSALDDFFQLPCEVEQIRGHTFESRAFEQVAVWLPDRRSRVFFCQTAIWHERKREGKDQNSLTLDNGLLVLGGDQWRRDDYSRILRSGLGHDFANLHLQNISLTDFRIRFASRGVSIDCEKTSGEIDMTNPVDGVARLTAYQLNGYRIGQGVRIDARFSPQNGLEVSQFVLSLPEVPLGVIGLGSILGNGVTTGRFAGQVEYRTTSSEPELCLRGELRDAELGQLTKTLSRGPLSGCLSINVDAVRFNTASLLSFRGGGRITNFHLAPLAFWLGMESLSGTASINLGPVDLVPDRINRLHLDGNIDNLSLAPLLRYWSRGAITGDVQVRINNIDIVEDNLRSADIEVVVNPPPNQPGTIDRELLLSSAEKLLAFTWPESIPKSILPKKVEFTQLGVRLLVRDNQLRILGTHGSQGEVILTIQVLGQAIELVKAPASTLDLGPYLSAILKRARTYRTEHAREWWSAPLGH